MHHSATAAPSDNSRWMVASILVMLMIPLAGCRICASDEDLAYPSYGGAWQRTIRDSGRVGSLFDPAGARAADLMARDTAITQDELERDRRTEQAELDDSEFDQDDESPMERDDFDGEADRPRADDDDPELDTDDEPNPEEKRRMDELREQDLDDVKIVPGDALPPLLR
ncbi:hypothetical protein [Planctomycetes bacterium K23_9]|uniref:Uncharacterized protein n=1 Tax=Stieleria marina TaxID=1930275 RepID=A0A517NTF7_9BACT|nr:hypothetical protein K239x_23630 [Planctomycetes bacterium K23_9]